MPHLRTSVFAIGLALFGALLCSCVSRSRLAEPASNVKEYVASLPAELRPELGAIVTELSTCFPFRVGMSIDEVRAVIAQLKRDTEMNLTTSFGINGDENVTDSWVSMFLAYFPKSVPTVSHCYLDLVLGEDGRVKSIFMMPGNASSFLPPGFRLAGSGKWTGGFRMMIEEEHRSK
jgi:hypothetical protein